MFEIKEVSNVEATGYGTTLQIAWLIVCCGAAIAC